MNWTFLNTVINFFSFQNESLNQKILRLEKLVEQEKRLSSNLSAEVESCRRESRRTKESSLSSNKNQMKQVIRMH